MHEPCIARLLPSCEQGEVLVQTLRVNQVQDFRTCPVWCEGLWNGKCGSFWAVERPEHPFLTPRLHGTSSPPCTAQTTIPQTNGCSSGIGRLRDYLGCTAGVRVPATRTPVPAWFVKSARTQAQCLTPSLSTRTKQQGAWSSVYARWMPTACREPATAMHDTWELRHYVATLCIAADPSDRWRATREGLSCAHKHALAPADTEHRLGRAAPVDTQRTWLSRARTKSSPAMGLFSATKLFNHWCTRTSVSPSC